MNSLHRILLETDAPYFPMAQSASVVANEFSNMKPFSQPGDTHHIAQCVARLRGMDLETIIKATRVNIKQVYDNTGDLFKPSSSPQTPAVSPITSSVESIRARFVYSIAIAYMMKMFLDLILFQSPEPQVLPIRRHRMPYQRLN